MFSSFLILFSIYCTSGQDLMASEGSQCTWNGATGQCVSVYRCVGAIKDIANRNYPPTCSFEGSTPFICCTDCDLVEDTRLLLFNPLLGTLTKTGTSKAKDKCLDYIHTLDYSCKKKLSPKNITTVMDKTKKCFYTEDVNSGGGAGFAVGGKNAIREEFPHMALLGYGDTVESASWLCGGTVISENFILTAAHCIYTRIGQVKYIALGILKRTDPIELWQLYNVKRVITHPEYQPPSKYHDIALLETDRQISFSSKVLPACLHVNDHLDRYATATGWGAIGHNAELADNLQSVLLRKFTEEECSKLYPRHRLLVNGYDSAKQVCYGDIDNQTVPTDTCEGDSGGPLSSQNHERCVYTIIGVTSYGRACGGPGGAGMYTRVNFYVPWIENIVWP